MHLAHIGHPLMGDAIYGRPSRPRRATWPPPPAPLTALERQALHAYLLVLEHPRTGAILEWVSDLPKDLTLLRDNLQATE